MKPPLSDHVALVTGASRGIGRAVAVRLARAGCRVAGVARSASDLEQTAQLAAAEGGAALLAVPADVTSDAALEDAVRVIRERLGRITVLINNAGVAPARGSVLKTPLLAWDRTLATCLRAPMVLVRLVLPDMLAHGGGAIINIASIYGPVGAPGYVAYTASKGAVLAMTKVAALEHAREGIRVNAICPGPVRTPMSEEEGDASVDVTPLRRRAEPSEISAAVAFLASDDAIYITGADIAVDGGYLAR